MYYSVTFINSSGTERNTWTNWHLVPTSPPVISPPEVYTNYVEIPGRASGPIDLSEALTGGVSFQNSEGTWEFILDLDTGSKRYNMLQTLKSFLHGKRMKVILEEDPTHYYEGRFFVESAEATETNPTFEIKYIIHPGRYKLDGTKDGI